MKKIMVAAAMLLSSAMFLTPVFAQGAAGSGAPSKATTPNKAVNGTVRVRGVIVSLDAVKCQVVIKVDKTGQKRTLRVHARDIASLAVGDQVEARVKAGTGLVKSIKKTVQKKEQ